MILARSSNPFDGKELPPGLEVVAFLLIRDVIRPEAEQTLRYFTEQGVQLKVISGDNPLTVVNIARRAGLPKAEDVYKRQALEGRLYRIRG